MENFSKSWEVLTEFPKCKLIAAPITGYASCDMKGFTCDIIFEHSETRKTNN